MKELETEDYFLVGQDDIYKIDSLISALNFALGEILEKRPVREKRYPHMPHQNAYDDMIGKIIYGEQTKLFD